MHGLSPDGVVAASASGEVWRYSEAGWVALDFPVPLSAWSLFASGRNDVWVAGDGRLFHHDGAAWAELSAASSGVPSGRWPSVLVGSGADDLWAYGGDGSAVTHFDGTRWSLQDVGEGQFVFDVLPVTTSETWAVAAADGGRTALVFRFDGVEWTESRRVDGDVYSTRVIVVDGDIWVASTTPQRLQGGAWVPADRTVYASDETTSRIPVGAAGLVELPRRLGCQSAAVAGAITFCLDERGAILHSVDRVEWTPAALDTVELTMPADVWDDYAPTVWAGDAEFAWGLAPESAIRFRPVTPPVDEPYGAWLALERMTATGFEPVTAPDGSGPFIATSGVDGDGVTGGPIWIVAEDALYTLSSEGILARVAPPAALTDLRVQRVAAIDADSAVLIGARNYPGTSLVLRVDAGEMRVLLERDADSGEGTVEFADVDVDADGGLWAIATADRPNRRAEGVTALYYSRDGEEFTRRDLWSTWGAGQIVVDGDQLWLVDQTRLTQLPRSVMDTTSEIAPVDAFGDSSASMVGALPSKLYVGVSGVWLSSNDRAVWLPR